MTKITVSLPRASTSFRPLCACARRPRRSSTWRPSLLEHFDLDGACEAARQRIAEFINRSAGQHWRHWRDRWSVRVVAIPRYGVKPSGFAS